MLFGTIGNLTKPQRQLRERYGTVLMSDTMAVHVRYNSWPVHFFAARPLQNSSTFNMKDQILYWLENMTTTNFLSFLLEFNGAFHIQFEDFTKGNGTKEF